jgi:hypothetical protein
MGNVRIIQDLVRGSLTNCPGQFPVESRIREKTDPTIRGIQHLQRAAIDINLNEIRGHYP